MWRLTENAKLVRCSGFSDLFEGGINIENLTLQNYEEELDLLHLRHLTSLKTLSLQRSVINSASIQDLDLLPNLTTVDLTDTSPRLLDLSRLDPDFNVEVHSNRW